MRIVRKIAMGLLAAVVLAVAGYLALALFVALVNATSSGQEEPTYNDDSLYDDYLNGQSHN
jgi:ABC-type Na+ efflux pump permease subunit